VISFTFQPLYLGGKIPPPGIHWVGGSVDSRTGLDDVERRKIFLLSGLEL
jgi:hypothetical protein